MATVKSSRPVLALEDLEEMEGMSLDDMLADEPISSPFVKKAETLSPEVTDGELEADPFLEETTPDVMEFVSDELELDDTEIVDELELELDATPEPEPVIEKPKRTRTVKPKATPHEDDFNLDDLDSVDSMPEPVKPTLGAEMKAHHADKVVESAAPYDPIEAMITSVGDVPEWMTLVIYGKNGTGKTTFGASGKKTLVLEIEKDGTFSVRDRGSEAKKYPVKSWDDFEKIYWYLKKNPGLFDIVCIDTLTRLSELCTRSVILNKKAEGAELLDKDLIRVTLPQYGDIGKRMTFWLNAFADLPCHKVWLCQEASGSEDKDVATVDAYPDLSRKIRIYVCSDATVIGRTEIKFKSEIVGGVPKEVPQFILRVAPSESYLSKDRTKALGSGLLNPKIDKLITKVYEV